MVPVIHEVYGGFSPEAVTLLRHLGQANGAKLGLDALKAPWAARSFQKFHGMRISVAFHTAAAEEILQSAHLDSGADEPGMEDA